MKLHIYTQYRENYGSEQSPYWKNKGGEDYFVPLGSRISEDKLTTVVMAVRGDIEYSHPMAEEHIIGWDLVEDNYMTDFERSQLEMDGHITYKAKVLEFA